MPERRSRMREEAPGEGGKEGRKGKEGGEKRRKSAPSHSTTLLAPMQRGKAPKMNFYLRRPSDSHSSGEGRGGVVRQGPDPDALRMPWPARLAPHNQKEGDGQDTVPLAGQNAGLSLARLYLRGRVGQTNTEGGWGEEGEGRKTRRGSMTSAAAQAQAQPQSTYLALVAALSLLPWMVLAPVV